MWATIKRLNEERGQVLKDMKDLLAKSETEKRDLTAEEGGRFEELRKKSEKLAADLDRANTTHALENQLREQGRPGRDGIDPDRPIGEARQIAGFAVKDLKRYSLLRAIRAKMEHTKLDGVEAEVSDELAKRCGKPANGFYFPTEFRVGVELEQMEQRTGVFNTTTGTGAVSTMVDFSNFIALLRNRVACQQMGARMLTGLSGFGTLSLPRQSGGGTGYWVAESGAPTASNQTVDQVSFTPKTVGAYTDLSRALILQSGMSSESFVREDLATIIAIALDTAALNGTGSSNQPLGLLQNTNISTTPNGTNGLATTFVNLVAMETAVAAANVTGDSLGYLTNSKVRGALKTTLQNTSSAAAQWVWGNTDDPNVGIVNGYKAMTTNSIPSNLTKGTGSNLSAAIFGNWSDLVIALWGQLDITVDPYTGSNSGTVRVVALQSADINIRHNGSFQLMSDIIA